MKKLPGKATANRKIYRLLFVCWSILLFSLTSYPKLPSPSVGIISFDKLAHLFFYFIFAWFFVKMHDPGKLRLTLRKTLILALIVPLLDELHQIPIPGREFSVWDIAADLLGFALVLLIFRIKLEQSGQTKPLRVDDHCAKR